MLAHHGAGSLISSCRPVTLKRMPDGPEVHAGLPFRLGHHPLKQLGPPSRQSRRAFFVFCERGCLQAPKGNCWLGRQDSNLGMAVPKTAALPLGDAPAGSHIRKGGSGVRRNLRIRGPVRKRPESAANFGRRAARVGLAANRMPCHRSFHGGCDLQSPQNMPASKVYRPGLRFSASRSAPPLWCNKPVVGPARGVLSWQRCSLNARLPPSIRST